jgi:hypothetical protein
MDKENAGDKPTAERKMANGRNGERLALEGNAQANENDQCGKEIIPLRENVADQSERAFVYFDAKYPKQ